MYKSSISKNRISFIYIIHLSKILNNMFIAIFFILSIKILNVNMSDFQLYISMLIYTHISF